MPALPQGIVLEMFVMAMQQNQGKPQQPAAKPGTPGQQRPAQTPMSKPGQQQQRPGQPEKKK